MRGFGFGFAGGRCNPIASAANRFFDRLGGFGHRSDDGSEPTGADADAGEETSVQVSRRSMTGANSSRQADTSVSAQRHGVDTGLANAVDAVMAGLRSMRRR